MKKAELVKEVAKKVDLTQEKTHEVVNVLFDVLSDKLMSGESYNHDGFGGFEPVVRAARKGRNPKTGEAIDIPEKTTIKFKVSSTLKKKFNE